MVTKFIVLMVTTIKDKMRFWSVFFTLKKKQNLQELAFYKLEPETR